MTESVIRNYHPQDEAAVEEITYRTGLSGEDLTGRGLFGDRRLFYLLFIAYYTHNEPEHCFVAEDKQTRKVMGFCVGTEDSVGQERAFQKMVLRKVLPHVLGVTLLRHPRTFGTLLRFQKLQAEIASHGDERPLLAEFPAHLHINLLPGWQGMGIGAKLIRNFETHLRRDGIPGVHLQTSNHNRKALPFYKKMGYGIVRELELSSHPWLADYSLVTFAKRLDKSAAY